jgi:hypothetical protein
VNGAAPAVQPLAPPPPPPPPFWCSEHGWVVCPLHEYDSAAMAPPPEDEVVVIDGDDSPLQPPTASEARPTDAPRVEVCEGDALAFVSAPTGASSFAFGTSMRSFSSAAFTDAVAPPTLPSPMPATPPPPPRPTPATPSPRTGARRRLVAFGSRSPARRRAAAGAAQAPGARRRWDSRTGWRLAPACSNTPPTRTIAEGAAPAAGEERPCGNGSWCAAAVLAMALTSDWGSMCYPLVVTALAGCGLAH